VRRLRAAGAAGATSLRAQRGFHGEHQPHGERLLTLEREAPVLTVVLDTPERIAALFELVDELTAQSGLVTSETVPALQARTQAGERGGLRLARVALDWKAEP
jgi:PII-like signaling protein